jgi:hypothetical protein
LKGVVEVPLFQRLKELRSAIDFFEIIKFLPWSKSTFGMVGYLTGW